jgi:hypothetical protein
MQKRPKALFSPGRSLLGEAPGHRQAKGIFGSQEWVVPRRDCQYRRQDFTNLPSAKRVAAARLAEKRFLPSPESRVHLAWQGGIAHYWIWAVPPEGLARQFRWTPETLLFPCPTGDGTRLLLLSYGVEGQLWRDGLLIASQWWPQSPTAIDWSNFQRAAGWSGDPVVPAPLSLEWMDQPWAGGAGMSIDVALAERIAWYASAMLLLAALGWQLTSLLRWEAAAKQEAVHLQEARVRAAPLMTERDRAEEAAARIQDLRDLEPRHSDYEWMARIAAALPHDSQLGGWVREPARLRVLVRSSETDPRRFIEAFVNLPPFDNLTATPTGAGEMLLEFDLSQSPGSPGASQ